MKVGPPFSYPSCLIRHFPVLHFKATRNYHKIYDLKKSKPFKISVKLTRGVHPPNKHDATLPPPLFLPFPFSPLLYLPSPLFPYSPFPLSSLAVLSYPSFLRSRPHKSVREPKERSMLPQWDLRKMHQI